MIEITEKAKIKIREFADAEGLKKSIRITVRGAGCSGLVRDMCFDDLIKDNDEVIELDDIKLIIDQFSFQYIEDTIIDYFESEFQQGFKFLNENLKSCGCGQSFSP